MAVDSSTGTVFLAVDEGTKNGVWEISEATDAVTATTTEINEGSIAVDPATGTAYVTQLGSASGNYINVVSEATDTIVAQVATGIPGAVAVDPVTGNVYLATGDEFGVKPADSLEVLNGNTCNAADTAGCNQSLSVIPGVTGAVAVDPATGTVYVAGYDGANNDAATVWVISEATNTVTATIPVGTPLGYGADAVAVDSVTGSVYVADSTDGTVRVMNGATNTFTATVPVGNDPESLAVDPTTGTVYATNYDDGTVSLISEATNTVAATISVGSGPKAVAVDPVTGAAYVLVDGGVAVIGSTTGTALSSSLNPAFSSAPGNSVTLSAVVTSTGGTVNQGTIEFTDGGNAIPGCGAQAVSNGNATCTTSFATNGAHSLAATYSGAIGFTTSSDTLAEQVGGHVAQLSGVVDDAATNSSWSGTETAGASAYDTATVTGLSGFTPTGTVTYSLFANSTCAGTATSSQTVGLSGGVVPNSATTSALGAGSYSFRAVYSGDPDYGSQTVCEPFNVPYANPLAVADSYTTNEGTTLTVTSANGVLANDTDPNGLALTSSRVSGPADGTLTLGTDGSVAYVPNSGFSGPDSFTYQDNDGHATSNVATVTINVNAVGLFAGFVLGDRQCTVHPTPAGSYDASPGSTQPYPCPAGTYNGVSGQVSCIAAPAGYYTSGTGNTTDNACAAGTFNGLVGQVSCIAAPAGYYASGTGNTTDNACAAGTFNGLVGQVSCIAAPAGYYASGTGNTTDNACAAGTFNGLVGQVSCIAASGGLLRVGHGQHDRLGLPGRHLQRPDRPVVVHHHPCRLLRPGHRQHQGFRLPDRDDQLGGRLGLHCLFDRAGLQRPQPGGGGVQLHPHRHPQCQRAGMCGGPTGQLQPVGQPPKRLGHHLQPGHGQRLGQRVGHRAERQHRRLAERRVRRHGQLRRGHRGSGQLPTGHDHSLSGCHRARPAGVRRRFVHRGQPRAHHPRIRGGPSPPRHLRRPIGPGHRGQVVVPGQHHQLRQDQFHPRLGGRNRQPLLVEQRLEQGSRGLATGQGGRHLHRHRQRSHQVQRRFVRRHHQLHTRRRPSPRPCPTLHQWPWPREG